jgi:hypothetical protein
VTARELPPAEREELFPKLTAVAPVIAESQSKTSRVIPLFELQQARNAKDCMRAAIGR